VDAKQQSDLPAIAICGFSNAGKTTLLEKLIPRLTEGGLKVAVLKHDVHGLNIDTPGKDSDRLYQSGADIVLQGPEQSFVRLHGSSDDQLDEVLKTLCRHYDLVLVEGRKHTPYLDKIWLRRDQGDSAPQETSRVKLDLGRDEDRVSAALGYIQSWLDATEREPALKGGIFSRESYSL